VRSLQAILPLIAIALGQAAVAEEVSDSIPLYERPQLVLDPQGLSGEKVVSVSMSADGSLVAAATGKQVAVWDAKTGTHLTTLRGYREPGGFHVGTINRVQFLPGSNFLVVAVSDNTREGSTRVYDLTRPDQIHQLVSGHLGCTKNIGISPSGDTLSSWGCDGSVFVKKWASSSQSWEAYRRFDISQVCSVEIPVDKSHGIPLPDTEFFGMPEDDDLLVWLYKDKVCLFDAKQRAPVSRFEDLPKSIHAKLHRLAKVQTPYVGSSISAMQFSTGSDYACALAGSEGSNYWAGVWSIDADGPVSIYQKHRDKPSAIDLCEEQQLVVSADVFGDVHIWEAQTGKQRLVLRPRNAKIYRVDWSSDGDSLLLSDEFYSDPNKYHFNRFGPITKAFDLKSRSFREHPPIQDRSSNVELTMPNGTQIGTLYAGVPKLATLGRATTWQDATRRDMLLKAQGQVYDLNPNYLVYPAEVISPPRIINPNHFGDVWSYTEAPFDDANKRASFFLGSKKGMLQEFRLTATGRQEAPVVMETNRHFVGHLGAVSSIAVSPDETKLATSGWDGTIRLWKLSDKKKYGDVDFAADGSSITWVPKGSNAERAGLKVGDIVYGFNDGSFFERHRIIARDGYQAGDFVVLKFARHKNGEEGYSFQSVHLRLVEAPDIVEPYLTLFIDKQGEWITHTPNGYYDASQAGQKYVGWHLNRNRHEPAEFYNVGQFANLYRPDIVSEVLKTRDEKMAVANVAQRLKHHPDSPSNDVDLADRKSVDRIKPPSVQVKSNVISGSLISLDVTITSPSTNVPNKVDLRNNGIAVNKAPQIDQELTKDGKYIRQLNYLIPTASTENMVTVDTGNHDTSTTASEMVKVKRIAKSEDQDLYVFAVGISNYTNEKLQLDYAHKDAIDFADAWKKYEGRTYRKVITKVITDEDATTDNIRDGMQWLSSSVRPGRDMALVFFGGHGVFQKNQGWYFGSVDLDPNRLRSTGIGHSELTEWLDDQVPCDKILFTDTCHAARAVRDLGLLARHPLEKDVWRQTNTLVISSCRDDQESIETHQWQNGAFTEALLLALSSQQADYDRDGQLSFKELSIFLDNKVVELTKPLGHQQNPSTKNKLGIGKLVIAKM